MTRVRIARLIQRWDMRLKHKLRDSRSAGALRHGEVLMAFNSVQDMCRLIDAEGGVHDYYADSLRRFDVDQVVKMVRSGLYVDLYVGQSETQKMERLHLVA